MALINRVTRLFKADFHAVLDQIEEPELLLKQAIREMEEDLVITEQRVKTLTHDQQTLAHRKSEIENRIERIDEELDLCFASQKPELARNLVRRKLEAQRLSTGIDSQIKATQSRLAEQRTMLDENQATLESLQQKAELFTQRASHAENTGLDHTGRMVRELQVSEDEVEVAYLRELNARSQS